MTKSELIDNVAKRNPDLTKKAVAAAVDAVFGEIGDAVRDGNDVTIPGFGSWKVVARAAREGRNPRTGEKMAIPAKRAVSFKAGSGLKDLPA